MPRNRIGRQMEQRTTKGGQRQERTSGLGLKVGVGKIAPSTKAAFISQLRGEETEKQREKNQTDERSTV